MPGNHDVNRQVYRPSDVPAYENMRALNRELENEEYRSDLFKGMKDYFNFMKSAYPHLKALDSGLVPFVNCYSTECGKTIAFTGLNSTWMCRKSPDQGQIAIGEYQIKRALKAFNEKGATDLQICLFHHPPAWLWPEERKICRAYFNNTILLCGHLHEPAGGYTEDLDGKFCQFQAGGAYLGSESTWPSRFHYITFDWQKNCTRLDFRKFVKDKRKWVIDSETGDDGVKTFHLMGVKTEKSALTAPGMDQSASLDKTELIRENGDVKEIKDESSSVVEQSSVSSIFSKEKDIKSSKKLKHTFRQSYILLFLFLLIISSIIAYRLGKIESRSQIKDINKEEQVKIEIKKEEKSKENSILVSLDPFIVNLADQGKYKYLKVVIQFEIVDKSHKTMFTQKIPYLKDIIIMILSSQSNKSLSDIKGRLKLKDEILLRARKIMGKDILESLYFTEFVMQ